MSAGARIRVRAASKRFSTEGGVVQALDGVSFGLEAGGALAVTGPSGCGKSTLLSLVGALERPTSGSVSIDDAEVSALDDSERAAIRRERIGFVFQSDNLQPFLTAVENVALALALAGREHEYDRAPALLASLGLEPLAGRLPDQLSGGERQRVAVARALVHRPRLILADEPTGALDGDNARAVVELLLEAQAQTGATLIVITHDEDVAQRMDRRLALEDGLVRGEAPEAARA